MEQNPWIFGYGGTLVTKDGMVKALGDGAAPFAYTTFGGTKATWYAEAWQSTTEPPKFGLYGHAPAPFAVVLDDYDSETDAIETMNEALARVILSCVAAEPAIAALHWRRDNGDELVIAATGETDDGQIEWYAASCFSGIHQQVACGLEAAEARRPAAEMVLRAGLIDETDEDEYTDETDLGAALAVEAWAAHVLAEETKQRATGVHGFSAGAEEVAVILRKDQT